MLSEQPRMKRLQSKKHRVRVTNQLCPVPANDVVYGQIGAGIRAELNFQGDYEDGIAKRLGDALLFEHVVMRRRVTLPPRRKP